MAAALVVPVAEGDRVVLDGQNAPVADGDTMRVAGEVLEDLLRRAERRLGVDDPLLVTLVLKERREAGGGRKRSRDAGELEGAGARRLREVGEKLAAIEQREDGNGEQEALAAVDPS